MKEKTKKLKKLLAFTLAEVLITLSILGVVAAITVPSIIQRQQKKEFETKLAKTISALEEAAAQYRIEYGLAWGENGQKEQQKLYNQLGKYLNYKELCNVYTETSKCHYLNSVTTINGTTISLSTNGTTYQSMILPDGVIIAPTGKVGGMGSYKNSYTPTYFVIDLNGAKGPNCVGKDIFKLPVAQSKTSGELQFMFSSTNSSNPYNRSTEISYCKQGDYNCYRMLVDNRFKFPSDYPW